MLVQLVNVAVAGPCGNEDAAEGLSKEEVLSGPLDVSGLG